MSTCRRALGALVLIFMPGVASVAQARAESDPAIAAGLEKLRAATKSFQSLDSAVAAGYPREVPQCLVHEQLSSHRADLLTVSLRPAARNTSTPSRLGGIRTGLHGVRPR